MLRLNPFTSHCPSTISEALSLLQEFNESAKLVAGGTDLIPNLKHELLEPKHLINLANIIELKGVTLSHDKFIIGTMTSLNDIVENRDIQKHCPSLAFAASQVAGPQLRQMGTIGGNLALDTRCAYYNQTYFWREALGFCLKKDGNKCHVTGTGKRCVAAASNDTATMLLALNANLTIRSKTSSKRIALNDFYVADGKQNNVLLADEMMVEVEVPRRSSANFYEGFSKLRHRKSIDFPMLSVGLCAQTSASNVVNEATIVINAIAAKPKVIDAKTLIGKKFNTHNVSELAELIAKRTHPLANINENTAWRKELVATYILKAYFNCLENMATTKHA